MKPVLVIDCLFHTAETEAKKAAGLSWEFQDLDIDTVTFYRIDAVTPDEFDRNNPQDFTTIIVGGEQFCAPYPPAEVNKRISFQNGNSSTE